MWGRVIVYAHFPLEQSTPIKVNIHTTVSDKNKTEKWGQIMMTQVGEYSRILPWTVSRKWIALKKERTLSVT